MTGSISITPRTTRFAGREVFTNRQGYGLFTRNTDGSHQQHTGTSQTPHFTSARQLSAFLCRHYPSTDNVGYGREG